MSYWKRVTSPAELAKGQRIRYYDIAFLSEDEMVGMGSPAEFKHWGLGCCGVSNDYPFGEWSIIEALFDDAGKPVLSIEVQRLKEASSDRERLAKMQALAEELLPHAVDGMAHCNGHGDVDKWHPAHRELYARAMELLGEQQLSAPQPPAEKHECVTMACQRTNSSPRSDKQPHARAVRENGIWVIRFASLAELLGFVDEVESVVILDPDESGGLHILEIYDDYRE